MAPVNQETLQLLKDKHLARLPSSYQSRTSYLSFKCTTSDVIHAVKSFPAGSSGGLDALRPDHLKDMLMTESANPAEDSINLHILTNFVNLILDTTKVPTAVQPIFFGARLIPLKKKDGGLRPIAVGNTLRRLV